MTYIQEQFGVQHLAWGDFDMLTAGAGNQFTLIGKRPFTFWVMVALFHIFCINISLPGEAQTSNTCKLITKYDYKNKYINDITQWTNLKKVEKNKALLNGPRYKVFVCTNMNIEKCCWTSSEKAMELYQGHKFWSLKK